MGRERTHTTAARLQPEHRLATPVPSTHALRSAAEPAAVSTVGNLAVCRTLAARGIRAKLTVSKPGDPDEQEADRVADRVMSSPPTQATPLQSTSSTCTVCSAAGTTCAKCEEASTVRRKEDSSVPSNSASADDPAGQLLRGKGAPLPPSVRAFFEPRFGRDFSGVRVHTDNAAAESARAIQARAFTTGQNVAFAPGEYNPESHGGRKLLAHELAHVDQAAPKVRRDANNPPAPAAPVDASAVTAAREVILDALEGYTTRADSENILNQFRGKSAAMVLAIVNEVKNYGGLKHNKTPDQMFEWLLGDLTEENRRELRQLLVLSGSPDAQKIVAAEIKDCLDGYTSEDDSTQIYTLLAASRGTSMDALLVELESQMHQTRDVMRGQLFGDLDRVNAEKVRQLFFMQGGPIAAAQYAAPWTARKVMDLIEGYTSHSDSTDIVWLFSSIQAVEMRGLVQLRLDELCRTGRGQSVSEVLMHDMDASDYERLRTMGGLDLVPYKDTKHWAEKLVSGAEWVEIVAEWAVCGIVGLVTGVFAAAWDLIKSVKDVVVAAWDLIWSLVYLISNGAAGSENWLRVKTFFIGIGDLVSDPGKVWDSYWAETKLEFNTIQGPFSDCRVAELFVRKLVVAIVNILLIFLAGYGLAKGAVAGARAVAEGAELAEIIGVRGVVSVAGRLATRRIGRFVAAGAEVAADVLNAIRKPSALLRVVGGRLRAVVIAAEDAGYWRYLKKQAGVAAQAVSDAASEQLAGEQRFWEDNRKYWRERAAAQQAREQAIAPDVAAIEERANAKERPDPPTVVRELDDEAQQLDKDSAQLLTDVTGNKGTGELGEGGQGLGGAAGKADPETMARANKAVQNINEHPELIENRNQPGKRRAPADPGHEIVEEPNPGGGGFHCEYHSNGGPTVPCPKGMGDNVAGAAKPNAKAESLFEQAEFARQNERELPGIIEKLKANRAGKRTINVNALSESERETLGQIFPRRDLEDLTLVDLQDARGRSGAEAARLYELAVDALLERYNLKRPYLRESTRRTIENSTPKAPDGSGRYIDPDNVVRNPPYQYGHAFGFENRRLIIEAGERGMTQEQFNEWVNSHPEWFRMESKEYNLSHAGEKPGND
jgi:hypothetical protein